MKWNRRAELIGTFGVPALGAAVYFLMLIPRLLDDRYYLDGSIPLWILALGLAVITVVAGAWWRKRRRR